ncbi:hypothetical protein BH11MYX3_BH11MYX3_24450 [soil metagenome]
MTMLRTLTFSLVLCAPLLAHAGDKAQPHIAKAMKAHKAGNFTEALAELQLAYKLDPRPELLFAIGQVSIKLDRCDDAVTYYEQYLATKPSTEAASDTREAIDTCKAKQLAARPPPPPALPPPSDSPYLPGQKATAEHARSPWYKDKVGDALVVGGVAATVIGLVLYTGARGDLDDAESAPDLPRYQELVDDAHGKRTWSIVLVGGGVALIGVGVAHYMLHDRHTETRGIGMAPTTSGGLVTFSGQF